jgi:hypothetical protein
MNKKIKRWLLYPALGFAILLMATFPVFALWLAAAGIVLLLVLVIRNHYKC